MSYSMIRGKFGIRGGGVVMGLSICRLTNQKPVLSASIFSIFIDDLRELRMKRYARNGKWDIYQRSQAGFFCGRALC
jgi:hypothetical protein